MNMYTKTNKSKKFILILVLLMMFNFCCPKQVHAFDFARSISSFFFWMESGILKLVNDLFCDDEHNFELDKNGNCEVFFTPETIIMGKFILLDANIFKDPNSYSDDMYDSDLDWLIDTDKNGDGFISSDEEGAKNTLRDLISGWYYSLLNFAIVALLIVLVYVGIRMIISTISQDKAKYKIMFKDWLIALCLLICMHYIMIAILNVTSMITSAIGTEGGMANQTARICSIIYNTNDFSEKNPCR